MGNWGRDFAGGVEPWSWTGSTEILEQYMRTKTPVKYGQCWVFCGVTTTSASFLIIKVFIEAGYMAIIKIYL